MRTELDYKKRLGLLTERMEASMREKDPEKSINSFIRSLGERAGADRISVYRKEGNYCHCGFEWNAADGISVKHQVMLQVGTFYPKSWWDRFYSREMLVLNDAEEYRESDPETYAFMKEVGIRRLVLCPIRTEGEYSGFLSIVNPDRDFMDEADLFFALDTLYLAAILRHKDNVDYIFRTERTDTLTGLYNMHMFGRIMMPLIESVRNGSETDDWDIVFFDIADFKVYNHEHGMYAGNLLLQEMAKILREELGNENVARFEADHFYALIEDSKAADFVKRVHDRLARTEMGTAIQVGIYTVTGEEQDGIQAADRAMMAGHETRGNFVHYAKRYDDSMESTLTRAAYLIRHVDEAVEKEWIKVYFQPIVGILSHEDASFEALSRWIDPTYGFMNPGEFISVLEDAHLLYKVDLFVIKKVCEEIKRREEAGEAVAHYSVNISRNDLDIPGIHKSINDILDSYGVPRKAIAMEITESAVMDQEEAIQQHIEEFHRDGYEVWLDDFGSGYSSLNTLHTFDFDLMKIDMLFLRNQNERTNDILTDIVDMAKRIGIIVLTEGVETKEQFEFLESIGCTYAQGFYISKPLPPQEVFTLLDAKNIPIETPEDSAFYRQIARVNIISLNNAGTHSRDFKIDRRKRIIAIVTTRDDGIEEIFLNSVGRQMLPKGKATTNDEIIDFVSSGMEDVHRNFDRGMKRLEEVGNTLTYYIRNVAFVGKMRLALVAAQGNRKAYLLTLTETDLVETA